MCMCYIQYACSGSEKNLKESVLSSHVDPGAWIEFSTCCGRNLCPGGPPSYFWRHSLILNLKISNSTRLADGKCHRTSCLVCPPLGLQVHPSTPGVCTHVLSVKLRAFCLYTGTSPNDPSFHLRCGYFLKNIYWFYVYEYLHVCMCATHSWKSEEGVDSFGTGVRDGCERPHGCWGRTQVPEGGYFNMSFLTLNSGFPRKSCQYVCIYKRRIWSFHQRIYSLKQLFRRRTKLDYNLKYC